VIRQAFAEASEALGEDLWQMVADGPAEVLAQTVNTQPLMLTAGVAVYREWIARGGALPSLVAGHSLGEYSALVAAGALDFQEAVKLVRLRAQAMQEAVPQGEGRWRRCSASTRRPPSKPAPKRPRARSSRRPT
jgi:[acyl-carrier-protein] S-malonyltransferase